MRSDFLKDYGYGMLLVAYSQIPGPIFRRRSFMMPRLGILISAVGFTVGVYVPAFGEDAFQAEVTAELDKAFSAMADAPHFVNAVALVDASDGQRLYGGIPDSGVSACSTFPKLMHASCSPPIKWRRTSKTPCGRMSRPSRIPDFSSN